MRMLLTVSYLGSEFYGFQLQKDKDTVQKRIEDALFSLFNKHITIGASGRTDAGVHALAQAVHFDMPKEIPPEKVVSALNFYLPLSVRVLSATIVADDFDARRSAKRKTYEYRFYFGKIENPFLVGRSLMLPQTLDYAAMISAAAVFEGKHDFNAFRCKGSSAKTTVRTVFESCLHVNKEGGCLRVTANGFLYKMVRVIMGSLILVGYGKITQQEVAKLLASGKEWAHKLTAPPDGLYLAKVSY